MKFSSYSLICCFLFWGLLSLTLSCRQMVLQLAVWCAAFDELQKQYSNSTSSWGILWGQPLSVLMHFTAALKLKNIIFNQLPLRGTTSRAWRLLYFPLQDIELQGHFCSNQVRRDLSSFKHLEVNFFLVFQTRSAWSLKSSHTLIQLWILWIFVILPFLLINAAVTL